MDDELYSKKSGFHQTPMFKFAVVVLMIAAVAWTVLYSKRTPTTAPAAAVEATH